jgi:hypothetical protein
MIWLEKKWTWVAILLVVLVSTTLWAAGVGGRTSPGVRIHTGGAANEIDPEPNLAITRKLLFIHQDTVTSFPPTGDGVRTGTFRGALSGAVTTNFQFLPVPPPEFAADDLVLLTDPDGDQVLFRVQVQGRFVIPLEGPETDPRRRINEIVGPFTGIYEVVEATGKYLFLEGRKFPCKGVGTLPAKNPALGSVYVEIFSDQFDF